MKKNKSLQSFQEEIQLSKIEEKRRKEAEAEEKKNYTYLNLEGISEDCYQWWLKVCSAYDLNIHGKVPRWMAEDLFKKW